MRKILLFVWACMGLVCLMSACKTSVKSKEWKLVWVEDFDQKNSFGSPDKPGGLSIQLCKSEKKEFYIRYSS